MTQMPPDSIVNEESFKKVMEHVYRDRIMISGVDAARIMQTYLVAEKEREDAKSKHRITNDKIRRNLEGVKTKTTIKAAKAKSRTRGRAKHSEVK